MTVFRPAFGGREEHAERNTIGRLGDGDLSKEHGPHPPSKALPPLRGEKSTTVFPPALPSSSEE